MARTKAPPKSSSTAKSATTTKTKTASKSSTQTTATPKRGTAKKSTASVTSQDIAERAYQMWEQEGYPSGRELEHWVAAEQELNGK